MGRKRRSSVLISFLVVSIFSASLGYIFGYYTYRPSRLGEIENKTEKNNILEDRPDENLNSDDRTVTSQKEVINSNTRIILRTYYERCNESVDKEGQIENKMVGLNEIALNEYILNNMAPYDLLSFSKDEVILLQKKDEICPKHFLVTDYNGFIIVYRFNEEGQRVVFQETSIPISMLPPVDQEKLKNGIIKNSVDEVTSLLEDYS